MASWNLTVGPITKVAMAGALASATPFGIVTLGWLVPLLLAAYHVCCLSTPLSGAIYVVPNSWPACPCRLAPAAEVRAGRRRNRGLHSVRLLVWFA